MTGTAQKHDKDKDIYVLSFIGYAPHDNPQVVCYAIVDTPDVDDPSSSAYASKLFSNVMSEVLPYLIIFKTEDTKKKDDKKDDNTKKDDTINKDDSTKKDETTKKDDGDNNSQSEPQTDNGENRDEKYNEPPLDNQMHSVPQESTDSTDNTSSTDTANGE